MRISQILSDQNLLSKTITVSGWIKTIRISKAGFSFIQLNDGSSVNNLQIVASNALNNYSSIIKFTSGCAITVQGVLVESQGKNQSVEMQASSVTLVGDIQDPATYPIQPKKHTLEFLREVAHLRPRTSLISSVTRIKSKVANLIHKYFAKQGFHWINTPILTSNDCEGAGELFKVSLANSNAHFFNQDAFLTVSGQLHVEAFCQAMGNVYTFGPTFRAENSNTSRHLCEFWMIEPEFAFAELDTCIHQALNMFKYLASELLTDSASDIEFLQSKTDEDLLARLKSLQSGKFEVLTYTKAIEILQESTAKFEYPVSWGMDLQSEHERYICEQYTKLPTVITDYPKDIKSFYMRLNDDNKTVAAMDILVPGIGEIVGGSQREERLDVLTARMQEQNIPAKGLEWYLDLRRYGTFKHAGFGLGLERFVGYITGVKNVRDLIPYPRTPGAIKY